jgi:hypothetical protein
MTEIVPTVILLCRPIFMYNILVEGHLTIVPSNEYMCSQLSDESPILKTLGAHIFLVNSC